MRAQGARHPPIGADRSREMRSCAYAADRIARGLCRPARNDHRYVSAYARYGRQRSANRTAAAGRASSPSCVERMADAEVRRQERVGIAQRRASRRTPRSTVRSPAAPAAHSCASCAVGSRIEHQLAVRERPRQRDQGRAARARHRQAAGVQRRDRLDRGEQMRHRPGRAARAALHGTRRAARPVCPRPRPTPADRARPARQARARRRGRAPGGRARYGRARPAAGRRRAPRARRAGSESRSSSARVR